MLRIIYGVCANDNSYRSLSLWLPDSRLKRYTHIHTRAIQNCVLPYTFVSLNIKDFSPRANNMIHPHSISTLMNHLCRALKVVEKILQNNGKKLTKTF